MYPQFAQGMTLRSRDEVEISGVLQALGQQMGNDDQPIFFRKSAEKHWFPHVSTHPTKIPKNGIYFHLHDSNKNITIAAPDPMKFLSISPYITDTSLRAQGPQELPSKVPWQVAQLEFNAIHRFGRERAETRRKAWRGRFFMFFCCWWLHHSMIPNMLWWSSKNGSLNTPQKKSHALEKSILQETSTTLHFPAPLQNLPDL